MNAIFLHRRTKALDKTAEAQKEKNEQDLFNTAITHLGNEYESVRLGGIYALYNLAKTTAAYQESVHEILSAYICSKTNAEEYQKNYKNKPSIEIQTLLPILTDPQKGKIFKDFSISFTDAYLHGANLDNAQLQGASLDNAQLQKASLDNAQLQGACSQKIVQSSFEQHINQQVGKPTALETVIFFGGMTAEALDTIKKNINLAAIHWDDEKTQLLEKLLKNLENDHVNADEATVTGNNNAIKEDLLKNDKVTGAYTQAEAALWIADYEKATDATNK